MPSIFGVSEDAGALARLVSALSYAKSEATRGARAWAILPQRAFGGRSVPAIICFSRRWQTGHFVFRPQPSLARPNAGSTVASALPEASREPPEQLEGGTPSLRPGGVRAAG